MRWLDRIFNRDAKTRTRPEGRGKVEVHQEQSGRLYFSPMCSTYENIFPQVRPLIDALKVIEPFGVGRNGARLPLARTPELALLDYPNEEMGRAEFMDLAFAMWLTEAELDIHVWKNGNRIVGYSILPPNSRRDLGSGDYYYEVTSAEGRTIRLDKSEVMALRFSRNPADISKGVSPAQTVFVQTQIADLLYQYERAFIENGAVPAYITIIRASTQKKFDETKREMERGFKGSKNKGKTLYLWRQYLPDGSEADQVEVKTIQPNNSTLAIKDIISIVKDDFNKAFGVSEFILGNDSSAKYDNAELSQQQFIEHRVKPALYAFWSQFQHELDRVSGGLGYGIGWELPVPELTERIRVKAEISEKNVANLKTLIESGARPKAAVAALELNENWLDVAYGFLEEKRSNALLATNNVNIDTKIISVPSTGAQSESKVEDVNNQNFTFKHDERCSHCHRMADAGAWVFPSFAIDEEREKAIFDELNKLIRNAINEALNDEAVLSDSDIKSIKDAILAKLMEEAGFGLNDAAEQIKGYLQGPDADEIKEVLANGGYEISDEFKDKMAQRSDELVDNLNDEAKEIARKVLDTTKEEALTKQQIRDKLAEKMPYWRAELIARNETVYAFRAAGLENSKSIAKKYNLEIEKVWHCHHDDRTCAICKAMDGQVVGLEEKFPNEITDEDGVQLYWEQSRWNDHGKVSSAHPRCRCYIQYKVIRGGGR